MLSWYGISVAFGIICILLILVVITYLVWQTKQLLIDIDERWKNVKISSGKSSESQLRAVRVPGERTMLQLQLGNTVSSTSSVHPTRETWLNIQNSSQMSSSNNNTTERTTMKDIQEMFAMSQEPQEGSSSDTAVAEGVYVTNVTLENPSDSSV